MHLHVLGAYLHFMTRSIQFLHLITSKLCKVVSFSASMDLTFAYDAQLVLLIQKLRKQNLTTLKRVYGHTHKINAFY